MFLTLRCSILTSLISFLFGVATAIAQVPPPPPPPPGPIQIDRISADPPTVKTPGATVRGRLVYEDSGAPIRYAEITLQTVEGSASGANAKTDEDGEFVLSDVRMGTYYPVVINGGILTPTVLFSPADSVDQRKAKLDANFQTIFIDGLGEYQFSVRARRGAAINGIVTYSDGEPAVGVKVEIIESLSDGFTRGIYRERYGAYKVETDDRGFYRFSGLSAGSYFIKIVEPVSHYGGQRASYSYFGADQDLFQTFYPGTNSQTDAEAVEANYGVTTEGINITLPHRRLYDVTGKVIRKKTGEPLDNFVVSFVRIGDVDEDPDADGSRYFRMASQSRFTNSYGEAAKSDWSITNLPQGKYRLMAVQQKTYGNAASTGNSVKEQQFPSDAKEIVIRDSDVQNVVFEISEGGRIQGVVVADDGRELEASSIVIAVNSESEEIFRSALDGNRTSKRGVELNFEFESLKAGNYTLEYPSRDFYVREVLVDGKSTGNDGLEVKDGETAKNIKIVLATDLATIKGRITNLKPGDNVGVLLLPKGADLLVALRKGEFGGGAGNDGAFEFRAPPGEYEVVVTSRKRSPRNQIEVISWLNELRKNAPVVSVIAKEVKVLELEAPK